MSDLWLRNLAFYSLQIALVAAAGAIVLRLLRVRIPNVRLICWQVLLAACLALPAIQPWLTSRTKSSVRISMGPSTAGDPGRGPRSIAPRWADLLLALVGTGAAVRFGILGLGFWRLRRYRRNSGFVPGAFTNLQQRLGVFADVQVSADVPGPVTFGFLRPVILLPEECLEDESIACHELVHVRRRDWLFTVIEECFLSAFWFHPAMWWMVAEIQLAREEVVDREVVAILNSRERYLESLLSLAALKAGLDLIPASPFLRKRHLQKRVAALFKEVSMSKLRLSSSLAAFAAALVLTGWLGVRSFPLQAAPQETDSSNVEVNVGGLTLLHQAPVHYPKEAAAKHIQGAVVLDLALSETGTVTDARVLSGPEDLRRAALESVLEWHFAHETRLPARTEVTIDFKLGAPDAGAGMLMAPPEDLARLDRLAIALPGEIQKKLEGHLTLHDGDRITQAALNELGSTLNEVDEHLRLDLRPNAGRTGSNITIWLENGGSGSGPKKIRVGGNVQANNLINKATPLYPPDAKRDRIQGKVRFSATIGKDGTVQNLMLVFGEPVLAQAAREAVQKWVYRPTLLNGDPVEVVTQVDVNFTLRQ